MPKVSIIVPVYNAEAVLRRCVDSILAQEFRDFELLLMDDGSKDSSGAICDEYASMDGRVRVVHKENSGVSDTRNQALDMARGEYIQFLDADDWIVPEATRLFVYHIETSHADMVIADFYRVVGDRISRKGSIEEEGLITRNEFADYMKQIAEAGATVLGGCCGTTPEHIKAVSAVIDRPVPLTDKGYAAVTSGSVSVRFGERTVIIGERINPTSADDSDAG